MNKFHFCKPRIFNTLLCSVFLLFSLLILLLIGRVFVYDQFPVNTHSMSPTISAGDKIIVNKLIFGARIYKNFDFSYGKPLKSFRIKGFRSINHNDIVVFNFPYDKNWTKIQFKINYVYTKRCIGLPGDSISIVNGFYKNNNFDDSLGYYHNQLALSNTSVDDPPTGIFKTYPLNSKIINWNIKNFGPLYIPKSGKEVKLNSNNYELYKILIEYETGQRFKLINDSVFVGTKLVEHYTFQNNYYFVSGDNIMNSADSRYFGFIPEEFIVGVVDYIIKNTDK